MTKTAVLVSGGGATLQALLDLCYFEEVPGLEIAAVISSSGSTNSRMVSIILSISVSPYSLMISRISPMVICGFLTPAMMACTILG